MGQIRIEELARELEVKSKRILDFLPQLGFTEKKTHSSALDDEIADKVRAHFRALEAVERAAAEKAAAEKAAAERAVTDQAPRERAAELAARQAAAAKPGVSPLAGPSALTGVSPGAARPAPAPELKRVPLRPTEPRPAEVRPAMMTKPGERGNWQGELFARACERLVTGLGFKQIFRRKHGIDMLASTPTGSSPGFLVPPPLPNGTIAFEFTSQFEGAPAQADELRSKIEQLRQRGKYQVNAGVVLCDIRVPEKQFPGANTIVLWDVRDASLLASKIVSARSMRARGGTPIERALSGTATYLWCLETGTGFHKAQAMMYVHEQTGDFSSEDLERLVSEFCKGIESDVFRLGIFPLQVEMSLRTRPFTTPDVEETLDSILQEHSHEDRVVYTSAGVISFFVAPWSFASVTYF